MHGHTDVKKKGKNLVLVYAMQNAAVPAACFKQTVVLCDAV
jgi:hypothetical protein